MLNELKELWKFRELLISLAERELRIRYKNSILGFLWSLINPLATVLVMTLVFKYFLHQSVSSYVLYVLAAYLPYMFFQNALLDSSQCVLGALPMVRKVYFPREVLPLAQILANFVHFLLAMLIFFVIAIAVWIRRPGDFPIQTTALLVPVLMIGHLALAAGLGLIVSAVNTFYEDVKYLLATGLYILFFLTPVMYFSENVYYGQGEPLYTLYHLNPIAAYCTAYKKLLLAQTPIPIQGEMKAALPLNWMHLGTAMVVSFGLLIFGYHLFNRLKWKFVERP